MTPLHELFSSLMVALVAGLVGGAFGAYLGFVRLQRDFMNHLRTCAQKDVDLKNVNVEVKHSIEKLEHVLDAQVVAGAVMTETLRYVRGAQEREEKEIINIRERVHKVEGSIASSEKSIMDFLKRYAPKL